MGKKRVVVFGIFDGVHEGHRDFFRQAKEKGDELVVVVGRDSVALALKGKKPKYSETERVALLQKEPLVSKAVLGDEELSTYKILEQLKPDVICFGYDQHLLFEDLQRWLQEKRQTTKIWSLKPYKNDLFHNSKLLKKA